MKSQLTSVQLPNLPRKIILAIDTPTSGVTLICQLILAFRASKTLGVPRLVQDLENKPVSDGVVATSTARCIARHCRGGGAVGGTKERKARIGEQEGGRQSLVSRKREREEGKVW